MTAFIVLDSTGKTIAEVVKFVTPDTEDAIEISSEVEARFLRAIERERELTETLRTGLPRRARGV